MLVALGFLAGFAGAVLLYLGAPRQQLLAQPLRAWPSILGGGALLTVSAVLFAAAFVVLTAIFVVVTLMMTVWSVIPLIVAYLRYRNAPENP